MHISEPAWVWHWRAWSRFNEFRPVFGEDDKLRGVCVCDCVKNVFHRLWEEGWKQRYYKTKFDVDATDDEFRKKVVQSYVEGLCWVLRYYYQVNHTSATVYRLP